METKLTHSQVQGQFPALPFLEYKGASEYTGQEVRDITSNFSTPQGFGKYLGILSNGEKVRVEQLPPSSASPKEFIDEVPFSNEIIVDGTQPLHFLISVARRLWFSYGMK